MFNNSFLLIVIRPTIYTFNFQNISFIYKQLYLYFSIILANYAKQISKWNWFPHKAGPLLKPIHKRNKKTPEDNFRSTNVRERIRTPDTLVRSQVLYPAELHTHIQILTCKTTREGLEPSTSAVTGRRSNQLNHRALFFFNGPSGTRTQDRPVMSRLL